MLRYVSFLLLALGSGLFMLNALGLLFDRDPARWATRPNDTTISAEVALTLVSRNTRESELQYVERMTELVHDRVTNPLEADIESHGLLRVGPLENWVLWLAGTFPQFEHYQTLDWRFGLKRGLGLCSQHAMVLVSILRDAEIPSGIQQLDGHVVAWVEVEGQQLIADADYGVVLPYSMGEIESNPTVVAALYAQSARELADNTLPDRLTQIYDRQGNSSLARWFEDLSLASHFAFGRGVFLLKWVIPIAIALAGALGLTVGRYRTG